MAVYKVPQDVEADDKLIGPFSFRQFIYLIIVAISIAIAWGLAQLFVPLFIIPLPVIIFFGALALPLRKDQPMEIYMAAIVSFYLKPRKRLWQADGIQQLVEVVAPKTIEYERTKNLSQGEAEQRLSYLAQIVDSKGWATRGIAAPVTNSSMNEDIYFEAQQTQDVLDASGGLGMNFDAKLAQADAERRQQMVQRMTQPQQATPAPTPQPVVQTQAIVPQATPATAYTPPSPYEAITPPPLAPAPEPALADQPHLTMNPYPSSMHQSMIQPIEEQTPAPATPVAPPPEIAPTSTSEKPVSPDIINLVNSSNLSIETIQREADRLAKKEEDLSDGEVVISLR